jgi:hypothetical protein
MDRFISQQKRRHQRDVVCKKLETPSQKDQEIEKSALGSQPSCCLQDSSASVLGPASAVAGDFVPPAEGGPGDTSSNSPGSPCATSADSPGRPADTPDRRRSSADDNRLGVASGTRACCKPVVGDDKGLAERLVDSNGNGGRSSGGSGGEWRGFILSGSAITRECASQKISAHIKTQHIKTQHIKTQRFLASSRLT